VPCAAAAQTASRAWRPPTHPPTHTRSGEGGELGATRLTLLPTDPMERVIALFPLLPAAYLTPTTVQCVAVVRCRAWACVAVGPAA
jgi:hypothetical protein